MNVVSDFERELSALLNRYSVESDSDTPDFILARYLNDCLNAFNLATNKRNAWYGHETTPVVQEVNDIKIKEARS